MGTRILVAAGLFAVLAVACSAPGAGRSLPAAARQASRPASSPVSPAPAVQATPEPVPAATPTPVPPAPTQPAAPPAQQPPPPQRTFPLGGGGSVTVTDSGDSEIIAVSVSGLRAIAHAVHLHSGCDGSPGAHIATIGTVGSAGTVSITVPRRLLGATVIVYPDASATGRPILCGATA